MSDFFKESKLNVLDNFHIASGGGQSTFDIEKIVSGAYHGQIHDLFIVYGTKIFGHFDVNNNLFTVSDGDQDEDFAPAIVRQCLAKGGNVHILTQHDVVGNSLAAVFRF